MGKKQKLICINMRTIIIIIVAMIAGHIARRIYVKRRDK